MSAITLRDVLHLASSPRALHTLGLGIMVGSSWCFVSGVIAFKTIPRQQFGMLQARTFPLYFKQQLALNVALVGTWFAAHPGLRASLGRVREPVAFQAWLLIGMAASTALNLFVVGPHATRLMKQRHKLERAEGKAYTDPDASSEMKALSKRFGASHSVSALINMVFFGASCLHLAWIGAHGF